MADQREHKRLHLRVTGLVQGVFFRAHTQEEAQLLGLNGWVRNRADGAVEIVAEGPEDALRRLAAWCHKGSPGAAVAEVEERWQEATGEYASFSVRW